MKILLLWDDITASAVEILKRKAEVIGPVGQDEDWAAVLAGADAVITAVQYQFTEAVLENSPRLRAIGRPGIGVDNVDLAAATRLGICVVNTPDAPTQPVIEKTVGWALALAHRLPWADRVARSAGWAGKETLMGEDLAGKTIGLVGLGRVGRGVARICATALGMTVLAYDPNCDEDSAREPHVDFVCDLHELIGLSDFVSLHCPLTRETRGLIGETELAAMKPSAYLINTARGPIVDEAALVAALQDGRIAGAALDVFDAEPLPPGHPLATLDNVLLGPHFGSLTREAVERMSLGSAEQVLMVLRGQRPPHLVNAEAWERRR